MKLLIAILTISIASTMTVFEFTNDSDISNWNIVDDVVMGGRSNGNFEINVEGYGKFHGKISLENNGGFSSVQYQMQPLNVVQYSKAILRIKGDGKTYQFRIKNSTRDYTSYVFEIKTTKDWMTVEVPFYDLAPQFRGRKLNQPNFQGKTIEEITFLIGNNKEEHFELLIDRIDLE